MPAELEPAVLTAQFLVLQVAQVPQVLPEFKEQVVLLVLAAQVLLAL